MMAGVDMVHVPYRGSAPMMTDLVGGQVQVGVDVMVTALPQIRAGKLRAIAVNGAKRFELLPEVPTIAETVPGYEAATWGGVGAPRGTPPEIIARLNRDINAGLANPAIRARLLELGTLPMIATAAEFGAYVSAEAEKWTKVVKAAGIKPDRGDQLIVEALPFEATLNVEQPGGETPRQTPKTAPGWLAELQKNPKLLMLGAIGVAATLFLMAGALVLVLRKRRRAVVWRDWMPIPHSAFRIPHSAFHNTHTPHNTPRKNPSGRARIISEATIIPSLRRPR